MPGLPMTALRLFAVGLFAVTATTGCGSQAAAIRTPGAFATAQPAATPTSVAVTPFPTPKGRPPLTPPPAGITPEPTGVTAGSPPVSYVVPSGYSLDLSTPQEVDLTSVTGAEKLSFSADPAAEDLSQAIRTTRIAGESGYVMEDGTTGYGYREDIVVRHNGAQYEALCIGYSGYDSSRLTRGCGAFLTSLAFTR